VSAALSLPAPSEFDLHRQGTAAFVLSLRERGVFDLNVLRAMETVPRDFFAPRRFADLARSDVALPIACGQTMTSPTVVATMLAALDVKPGQRILEVGTGTGYVTALLARIGAEVHTVERHPTLAESAARRLELAGFSRVKMSCGDGLDGGEVQGRYHRIILNGVLPYLSPALTSRLVVGGRLVAGAIMDGTPQLLTIARNDEGDLAHSFGAPVRLSPLLPSKPQV
jgi:protein-L-isoaspartate(D-aspartate) O-methyltransferase